MRSSIFRTADLVSSRSRFSFAFGIPFLIAFGLANGLLMVPNSLFAQFRPFGTGAVGGVYIDPQGVLKDAAKLDAHKRLQALRTSLQIKPEDNEVTRKSPLRKISLKHLEETVQTHVDQKVPLPAEVRYLAGLQKIQYVLFYPEYQDVILVGPAENWKQASSGEIVGEKSGRPVLHLEDLLVGLRYAYQKKAFPFLGCSIDPTVQGMTQYAKYMRTLRRMDRSRLPQIFQGMEQAMGMQQIRIFGVPESSRAAQIMVAADYRLKRIALAHDPSPVKQVVNYLDLTAKQLRSSAPQKQHRWWFQADYEAILHSEDHLAYELQGEAMKVTVAPTSQKVPGKVAKSSPTAVRFSETFTSHMKEMSLAVPVFAELQNVIGLSVASELIARKTFESTDEKPHWKPTFFLDAKQLPLGTYDIPKQVPSLANYRFVKNQFWLISVSGGVEIHPQQLTSQKLQQSQSPSLLQSRRVHQPKQSDIQKKKPVWWWD